MLNKVPFLRLLSTECIFSHVHFYLSVEDTDVQRLLTEIEECLDTLQYLPPDLQTEIGLALQPLRSENSQLRRRLRIANQQIRRLEKGEDKENVEPPVDVEGRNLKNKLIN